MYEPSPDQAERDRKAAFKAGIPHGMDDHVFLTCKALLETQSGNTGSQMN